MIIGNNRVMMNTNPEFNLWLLPLDFSHRAEDPTDSETKNGSKSRINSTLVAAITC